MLSSSSLSQFFQQLNTDTRYHHELFNFENETILSMCVRSNPIATGRAIQTYFMICAKFATKLNPVKEPDFHTLINKDEQRTKDSRRLTHHHKIFDMGKSNANNFNFIFPRKE